MTQHSIAWSRQQLLPQAEPPVGQGGCLFWIRSRLFNGWWSSLLTILSLVALAALMHAVFPWLANSVWQADSLGECRRILNGESGACWGVIRERWPQLVFGFYPPAEYWRPLAAFVLLFVALGPILFKRLPRRLVWFSVVYPGLVFWLIWGGSLWAPGMVYAIAAAGGVAFRLCRRFGATTALIVAIMVVAGGWLRAAGSIAMLLEQIMPLALSPVSSRDLGGFLLSLVVGVTGIAMSLPLGIVLALGRRSSMPLIRLMSVTFIEFVRGVPLITLLFTASLLLNYFLPPGTSFDLILRVIIMVTVFSTAYMAEVIRGGLAALPPGQSEAAQALGLDYWKAQRLVIMPQTLKISIPMIVSTFIGLFKDTTLVVFIGLLDPIALSTAIRASTQWQGIYWELFLFIGGVFFLFCFGMSRYSIHLEQRLKTDHR
ncbi:amino acid ABC transporter permease [Pseudomonas sp. B21-056]|jgi:general L-amino acid transport system permease protein|uniref:amino acid ABC transporter permease n=1 Tax=Pseudomonas sp. B21-056 TaxID=2895495 RepID=UPI002231C3CB|nr:amino acid ABC transporter permease [Pseudomonas sp. B21-056]UZE25771.1 amino acid ABC transporter permease [Pseudomonas sp. B21-056]